MVYQIKSMIEQRGLQEPYKKATNEGDKFQAKFELDRQKAADNNRNRHGNTQPCINPHCVRVAHIDVFVGPQIGDYIRRHVAECVA